MGEPLGLINAAAPIRICDNGGWTDTWFSGHGRVFNIAVQPCVEVQVAVHARVAGAHRVVVRAENLERPDALLAAAVEHSVVPDDVAVEVSVFSDAPVGSATGTSAATAVALLGALDALTPGRLTPAELASAAHRLEARVLGRQSGVQDQLCAAYGGINDIEITYPHASVTPIHVADQLWWELERRLTLVYLGRAHDSSAVHEQVIGELGAGGGSSPVLKALRTAAARSSEALRAGDLTGLGRAMVANTEAQAALHPDLVGPDARAVMETAQAFGAEGWKVNGAGGDGGSVTVLGGPVAADKRDLHRALAGLDPRYRCIPIQLSRHGLRVWSS